MKCYALGFRGNSTRHINWWTCGVVTVFFLDVDVNQTILSCQQELVQKCDSLELGDCDYGSVTGYYLAAIRHVEGCCLIACDQKLTKSQTYTLSLWMLQPDVTLDQVANNINTCINQIPPNLPDNHLQQIVHLQKVELLNTTMGETAEIVRDSLESVIQRGEAIEDLLVKSEQLKVTSFKFKEKAEDMNSCWRKCNLF